MSATTVCEVKKACLIFFALTVCAIMTADAVTITAGGTQSSTPVIARGDSVIIQGTATGNPQQGLQVWLLGNNHADVNRISVNSDTSYEYEIRPADTQNLASGQYFVLIQHPMMNGQFDIIYNAATGQVVNRQLAGGAALFRITGSGSLPSPAAASALVRAVADQNIDDTFTTVSFMVQDPNALIDPIGTHVVGDRFTITGTTNLAVGDDLYVEVYSESFAPTKKGQGFGTSGMTGMVKVMPGNGGYNTWSFDVDTSTLAPDEYFVRVSAALQNVQGSTSFALSDRGSVPAVTVPATGQITARITGTATVPATTASATQSPTTKSASAPLFAGIAGCAAGLYLMSRRL